MHSISSTLFEAASNYDGTWEWAGKDHNPVVLKMYSDAGHPEIRNDEVPWCAAFVGSVLAQCGLKNTGSLLARSYENWGAGKPLATAVPGDIVVLSRGDKSWQGHVGFYVGKGDGVVKVLGGNQGNQVNISDYAIDRVVAVREPKKQRTNPAQSTTLLASAGTITTLVGTAATILPTLEPTLQVALGLALLLCSAFTVYIFWERLMKFKRGQDV